MSYIFNIKNFQSIADLRLTIQGFTALVGKSNRGKSAIIRALRTVLLNEWNQGFIRVGERETRIAFAIAERTPYLLSICPTLDVQEIALVKPSNEYTVTLEDGSKLKYPKVGKGVPETFEDLNLSPILTEREDSFNLNFQGQLDPLFLITATEVEITSFINKVFDISRFEKALREMKSDDIKIARDLSESENGILGLEQDLLQAEDNLRVLGGRVFTLGGKIKITETFLAEDLALAKACDNFRDLLARTSVLDREQLEVEIKRTVAETILFLANTVSQFLDLVTDRQGFLRIAEALSKTEKILTPTHAVSCFYQDLEPLCSCVKEIRGLKSSIQEVQTLEIMPPVYTGFVEEIKDWERACMLSLGISKDMAWICGLRDEEEKMVPSVKTQKQKLEVYENLREQVLGTLDICPVCEQIICRGEQG